MSPRATPATAQLGFGALLADADSANNHREMERAARISPAP